MNRIASLVSRGTVACALLSTLTLGCATDLDPSDTGGDFPGGGKADADAVALELARVTADGELSADDALRLFDAAGGNVSKNEMLVIRDATESTQFAVTAEAIDTAHAMAAIAGVLDPERDHLVEPSTGSYAGTDIPDAVRELVARARLSGAVVYDVRERDGDGELRWTPYPSTTPPVGNMTFDYTEVTPAALDADIADTAVEYNAIVGQETAEQCDGFGNCFEFEQARYERRTGGTGNVLAHYDEVHHPDLMARGRSGQKWANNCAILSDGSLHCLPAARRSELRDLILTNPALSRCNRFAQFGDSCRTMLYNGHVDIRGGVVVGVEVSGRVSKRVARGRNNLVDPIAVLEAWGFDIAPGVRIRYGNTEDGVPVRNLERGILEAQP